LRWGASRSISQLHVLLNLLPQPLTAEEISDTLAIAHSIGDRRDHFEARKVVRDVVALMSKSASSARSIPRGTPSSNNRP
jgi:DNA-binding transcriptional regulator GbsR (MarR family)